MRKKGHSAGGAVLIMLALSVLLEPVTDLALPQPVYGSASASTELIPWAYIPIVMRPEVPDLAIYDKYGTLQDWDWLVETFGPVSRERGDGAAQVVEIREAIDMALIVRVVDINGDPIIGQEVVFYWPDAPELQAEKQACGLDRGLILLTSEDKNGNAEFIMGPGSMYYPDRDEAGPHVVWVVRDGTDCLYGLGWIAGTDHYHLNSVWVLP